MYETDKYIYMFVGVVSVNIAPSCPLEEPNSPNSSVIDEVQTPPPKSLSNAMLPVDKAYGVY